MFSRQPSSPSSSASSDSADEQGRANERRQYEQLRLFELQNTIYLLEDQLAAAKVSCFVASSVSSSICIY
jgi:hypothetical protein